MSTSPFHLMEASVESVHAAMRAGQISSRELTQLCLNRIAAYDQRGPVLNTVQTLNSAALEQAEQLDARFKTSGPVGPLHGIPLLLKDQVETKDLPTSYGSKLFSGFMSGRDATIVEKLRAAGAIILAKNTMSEYAQPGYHGSNFGVTRNPYDPARSPGGSSCGTGVGIAARFGVLGVGEDTGGSIRNPASYNGLVGLRPTMGLISRCAVLPGTPSKDTLGPMTRGVRDAALLLDVLAGYDPGDALTGYCVGHVPASYTSFLRADGLHGRRLGVIRESFSGSVDRATPESREVWRVIEAALVDLAALGAVLVDPVPLGPILELLRRPSGVGESEAAVDQYLAQLPHAPVKSLREIVLSADDMVQPSQRALLGQSLGRSIDEPAYAEDHLVREQLRQLVLKTMADYQLDALVYCTIESYPPLIPDDILTSSQTRRSVGSNSALSPATGFPALTIPAGLAGPCLPVGLSFLGRPWSEGLLFQLAYAYEQAARHVLQPASVPPLAGE